MYENSKHTTKKIFIILAVGWGFLQTDESVINAIIVTPLLIPRQSIERTIPAQHYSPQIAYIPAKKGDKITVPDYSNQQSSNRNLALPLSSGSISLDEAILQLRGGEGFKDVVILIVLAMILNKRNWFKRFSSK